MASLKSSGQTVPYVADNAMIAPAACGDRQITASAALTTGVAQVEVYVNGRFLGRYQVVDRSIGEVPVPRGMLECEGRLNCVAFAAYGQNDALIGRNFCIFRTPPGRGTQFFIR